MIILEDGIILILSEPGTGKTSLVATLTEEIYYEEGRERFKNCCEKLEELNKSREQPFELPTQVPIYTPRDFELKFQIDYEKWYKPYMLNPYYLGLTNKKIDTQYLFPYSVVCIPEFQKYTNSRKGQSLPEAFHRTFEIHRHWHLLFIMDGHRGSFIDLKVRALTRRIIEVQHQVHEYDEMERIIKTTWYCREFDKLKDYDEYIDGSGTNFRETTYTHDYDIFEDYNSYSCSEEFIPPEGKTFSTLKHISTAEIEKLPPEIAKFYSRSEPENFRGTLKEEKEVKEKCAKKSKS